MRRETPLCQALQQKRTLFVIASIFSVVALWKLWPRSALSSVWFTSGQFVRHHMDVTPQFNVDGMLLYFLRSSPLFYTCRLSQFDTEGPWRMKVINDFCRCPRETTSPPKP